MTHDELAKLYATASGAGRLLILPHNDPDPDAIASAVALRYLLAERLGMESTIAYQGIIGRAENKALVRGQFVGLHPQDASDGDTERLRLHHGKEERAQLLDIRPIHQVPHRLTPGHTDAGFLQHAPSTVSRC